MMKNFSFWCLPAGATLWFQRHRRDGLTWRTVYTANTPIEVSVTAGTWTRDAYYGPGEQRRFGQWQRTLHAMWQDTGRVMSSYCPDQPQVWGGLALAFPRLNLSLGWQSRSWMGRADQHGRSEPCQACTDAGRPQPSTWHETRNSLRRKT